MTVMELIIECRHNDECDTCVVRPECNKYQKMVDCVNLQRPDMLNTCINYLIDLLHSPADLSKDVDNK